MWVQLVRYMQCHATDIQWGQSLTGSERQHSARRLAERRWWCCRREPAANANANRPSCISVAWHCIYLTSWTHTGLQSFLCLKTVGSTSIISESRIFDPPGARLSRCGRLLQGSLLSWVSLFSYFNFFKYAYSYKQDSDISSKKLEHLVGKK